MGPVQTSLSGLMCVKNYKLAHEHDFVVVEKKNFGGQLWQNCKKIFFLENK